ncbi:transposable element Tcb1 transposase [Trichonephila clavipes]|uniref:Transposable element Tcb1 transposase n=1 Tax=Trichonephila clavipes TaxID=2585209 RepID=A0A8X7BA28_TRICX|nr:transposable element Tcb1 transposase [Trichonephila clavipes]
MVWGAIAYDSRSTLIVMRGTITGQRYVDDILRPHVGYFPNGLPGVIFQEDNAPPHTARVAQDFLPGSIRGSWIAKSVISRIWQRFQDDGNVSRCYSTSCPRVTTPNEDRHLAVTAKRNRRSTAPDPSRQFSSATGTTVSRQSVYRRLGRIGLYAHRSVRCVPITATHCPLRLIWSREHALGTPQQWSCVMFSDESRFGLQSDTCRTLIWRVPGTRYHQENTIERHRYGGA